MVDKIEDKDVESLGETHLSSMMSGIKGDQIKNLEESKKSTVLKTLKANFFGSEKVDFKQIESDKTADERPTIEQDDVGKTKIGGGKIPSRGMSILRNRFKKL